MNDDKHKHLTPEVWRAEISDPLYGEEGYGLGDCQVYNDNDEHIADCNGLQDAPANAQLIAAAPNLKRRLSEACDLLVGAAAWLEECGQPMVAKGLRKWEKEKGQTAIEKAEGGTP